MIKIFAIVSTFVLSGCTAITVASTGLWGATGKSATDHTLSYVTDRDCKTLRIVTNDKVCQSGVDRQEEVFRQRH